MNTHGTIARFGCGMQGHRWASPREAWVIGDDQVWACSRCGLVETDASLDVLMTEREVPRASVHLAIDGTALIADRLNRRRSSQPAAHLKLETP